MVNLFVRKGGLAAALALSLPALSGCAAVTRTRPGDMTVPEHEAAARVDAAAAERSAAAASSVGRGGAAAAAAATRSRELARRHSAAAQARRDDVARTCEGTDPSARPIDGPSIATIEPIREPYVPYGYRAPKGYYPNRLVGARLTLRSSARSATQLTRDLECEAARVAAGLPSLDPAGPLAVASATASVRAAPPGVVVELRGRDGKAAAEILRRAEALASADR